jgi:butyryl-CoA dehydrogenase
VSHIVDRRYLDFLLYDFLGLEKLFQADRYQEWDRETVEQILATAEKIAEQHFFECAADVDANEPVVNDGKVSMPQSVADCLAAQAEAGFMALLFDAENGDLQAPWLSFANCRGEIPNLRRNDVLKCAELLNPCL